MRKTYNVPVTTMWEYRPAPLLQASGVTSNKGIGYGGVDGNGTHEADTRRKSEWDEEPEDY